MDARIEKVLLYITQNFRKELFLDTLAKEAHLSKFHFQRLFKSEMSLSPTHYINKIRLEHAAHILVVMHNCTPADAAFDSGFSSPAVFSRSFKNYYNQSPTQYKKANQHQSVKKQANNTLQIPITYLKKQKLKVHRSNLVKENLDAFFDDIQKKRNRLEVIYGVFVDAPMHINHAECRYYAGFVEENSEYGNAHVFEIDEGFYTSFNVSGNFSKLEKQIVEFKEKFIDQSPYYIASTIAFEKLKLHPHEKRFDYFKAKRTIFIKIKR